MPGLQPFRGLGQQHGILDAVPPPRLARRHELALAALLQACLGACHRARVETEGLCQRGVRGEAKQCAASETQIAPDFVVDSMRGDRLGEQEVDEVVVIAEQAQASAEGQGVARLEGQGGRLGSVLREGFVGRHWTKYIKRYWDWSSPQLSAERVPNPRFARQLRREQALRLRLPLCARRSAVRLPHHATSPDVPKSETQTDFLAGWDMARERERRVCLGFSEPRKSFPNRLVWEDLSHIQQLGDMASLGFPPLGHGLFRSCPNTDAPWSFSQCDS